jgi:hypothetical protein
MKMFRSITELNLLRPGESLAAVTSLRLWDQATLPPGIELPAVTSLELGGQATLPPGIELPAVTSLELGDQATLPPGIELPAQLAEQVPTVENLHRRVYEAVRDDPAARLDMSDWHKCETKHCRAGWAIHLAGEAGRQFEDKVGVHTAGALIYLKNTGMVPDFFCDNATALADIERCALAESAARRAVPVEPVR